MSEKEKPKSSQQKNIPKDGQVIMAIMKEMGISEYEPKTIIQLTEFVYRYATSVLEEARTFANNSKKKFIDLEDVRLALQLSNESTFTTPPPRERILECARTRNNSPLPIIKPHCGLRLPPDRHCLSACNYVLKSATQKKQNKASFAMSSGNSGIKITAKPNVSYIKRTNTVNVTKQTVTVPRPITKITTNLQSQQKTILKPKIQISQNAHMPSSISTTSTSMDIDDISTKRKREDDEFDM